MIALVFLAASLTGQCPDGVCVMDAAQTDRPYYVVTKLRVKHDGLSFDVYGYFRSDTGKITWEPTDPRNQASWAEAKAKYERKPTTVDRPIGQDAGPKNFGLSPDRLRGNSTYTTTGEAARQFVLEAKSPEAAILKLHVTVIGSDDARAPVVNDLKTHPEFASLKSHLMVQDYKPGEWEVDPSLGFRNDGKPTIIVQTAKSPGDPKGGRVIYRANGYESGPKGLAEAIRRADPNYRPDDDPWPTAPGVPDLCPLGFNHSHWPYLVGSAFLLFALVKLPRKEG